MARNLSARTRNSVATRRRSLGQAKGKTGRRPALGAGIVLAGGAAPSCSTSSAGCRLGMAITGATLERSACRAIDRPLSKGDDMAFISTSTWKAAAAFKLAAVLAIVALVLFPTDLAAQGQPVQNGPMLPLALWWGGACVLGLVMVYAILRDRDRTRSEKQVTDQATKDLYAREERDRKRSGSV